MRQQRGKKVSPPPADTLLRRVRTHQGAVFVAMAELSKQFGADVFRIAGQRYFAHERQERALQREIAEREAELERLRHRASS